VPLAAVPRPGAADRQHRQRLRLHAAVRGLEELHQRYGGKGLAVLGFPCNQFGSQDPGSNDEIGAFCS
jgi:glutathione peroxidase-family protein